MRLGQIRFENKLTAAVFTDGQARPIPGYTTVELIRKSETENISLLELASEMAIRHSEPALPAIPLNPVEVWGCGCTYERSADYRDEHHGLQESVYAHVYNAGRPEIFFKGTSRVCVGPGQAIGIRADSRFTAPEPELAVILGRKGKILGYTVGNDVSAWDISRENLLYLTQAKIYSACCSLGPVIVTTNDIPDPHALEIMCTITRGGKEVFSGRVSTSRLQRRVEDLVEYLLRANPVPAGTALLTGTGIIVPDEARLQPDDVVSIAIGEIGELSNPAAIVE